MLLVFLMFAMQAMANIIDFHQFLVPELTLVRIQKFSFGRNTFDEHALTKFNLTLSP